MKIKSQVLVLILALVVACTSKPVSESSSRSNAVDPQSFTHLEIPLTSTTEHPIHHTGFTVLFDKAHHVPRWVAYHLNKATVLNKAVDRSDHFHRDLEADGCPTPQEYKHSGFDRGHLAAAEDMRWSARAMDDSFLMSNMTPQSANLNRGIWKRLEEQVRAWVQEYDDVYVVAGPVLTEPCLKIIGNQICVPHNHFKVILQKTGADIKTIGFIIPQDGSGNLIQYVHTVSEVQKIAQIDFFSALPEEIEDAVESSTDLENWFPKTLRRRTPAEARSSH